MSNKQYKAISLFSGIGGSSLGYKMAGFNVLAAVEFIDYQASNYRLNHPNTKVYEEDIRKLDPGEIMNDLNLKESELDVLDGSPPCSSFSTAGQREKGWGKVKQYSNRKQRTDDLFFEYIRFLKVLKPKAFVAENVSGLIKGKAKGCFLEILKELKSSGYKVKAKVINAKYYNVPQSRERTIFIGVREDLNVEPSYPIPNKRLIKLREAFKNIKVSNQFKKLSGRVLELYLMTKPGTGLENAAEKKLGKREYFTHYRNSYNKPSFTITQGTIQQYHPVMPRTFTIPELKRIVTFPDDFILEGSFAQQWEACGRAVPPLMMKAIAENIKENILDKR